MRLFIAIEIPDSIREFLKDLQKQVGQINGLKFVKEFHLTLKFLGETSEKRSEEIKKQLRQVVFDRFELTINKVEVFPNKNSIRIVWVGVKENAKLSKLRQEIEKEISMCKNCCKISKKFYPHITIARLKFIREEDKKKLAEKLDNAQRIHETFTVTNFRLIKSVLTKSGSVYEVLKEFQHTSL